MKDQRKKVSEALAMPFQLPESKLIAFVGPKGCGKTIVASLLREGWDYKLMSFAEPMRAMLAALIGDDHRALSRTADKMAPIKDLEGCTMRHALQTLGTEWGRDHIGPNLWVNYTYRKIKEAYCDVTIDDLRFLNEAAMLEELGAYIVRIEHPDFPRPENITGHQSETEQWSIQHTHTLHNNGNEIEPLKKELRRLMVKLDES